MHSFYIKELAVRGAGRDDSVLELTEGLNIIKGPSNTGKSYVAECIDFMFGSKEIKLSAEQGYDSIRLVLETLEGEVVLSRDFDKGKIDVVSANPNIQSGKYGTGSDKNNISDVWLRLIGIKEPHEIIKNGNYEKRRLTWRSFCHMFLIKEQDVIGDSSIVMPQQATNVTSALTALLFLMTGEDYADTKPIEKKEIKETRREAAAEYVMKRLEEIAERRDLLETSLENQSIDSHEAVARIIDDLGVVEKKLSDAFSHNQILFKELFSVGEQLAECETLSKRYDALRTQYHSDVKRLTFIIEGQVLEEDLPKNHTCPYCENEIPALKEEDYIETSRHELLRLQLQLKDLEEAQRVLMEENSELTLRSKAIEAKKEDVESLINRELEPRAKDLRASLVDYKKSIEMSRELEVLNELHSSIQSDYYSLALAEAEDEGFKARKEFNASNLSALADYAERILKECRLENFNSVAIDTGAFDLVVNNRPKKSFGKGYRAFLNTAFAITLAEYLLDKGVYAPGLLIVDSPILSLKERVTDEASDSMKSSLFEYLLRKSKDIQLIIIENTVPDGLDYRETNVIEFTKEEGVGRYGLITDVR